MKIIKRDGHMVDYYPEKIENAINKANEEVDEEEQASRAQIRNIIKYIEKLGKRRMLVEDIQDIIEIKLMSIGKYQLAKKYITYRYTRELVRRSNTTDQSIKELIDGDKGYINKVNSKIVTAQRDYLAGITSTDITRRFLLSEDIVKAHDEGIIHFHDAGYFAQNALHNCGLINLEDMLENGTNINGVMIERPHRFSTAVTIATQLIAAVNSNQYGGCAITLSHLAPFLKESYKGYVNKYKKRGLSKKQVESFAEEDLQKELTDGVQTLHYQINSMTTTNGIVPNLSIFMYLGETKEYEDELAMIIEEVLKQRIKGTKDEEGKYVNPDFPRLIYVLDNNNISKESKYYYLTDLALTCTSKCSTPSYISSKVMKKIAVNINGDGDCYPCMEYCSFLSPDRFMNIGNISNCGNYVSNKGKYYGRFNQGAVTLNLPDIALSSDKNIDLFWDIFKERLELCHRALQIRHKRLSRVTSDVAPILWQHGAVARLKKEESIHELLHHGYSTISLGYAGLYECVKYMTGNSHFEDGIGKDLAVQIMEKLNDACEKWKEAEDIDYMVYATPFKSTMIKFANCLKERFGVIKGITDKDEITNSYHIPEFEIQDDINRLEKESDFQKYSIGGMVSHVSFSNKEDLEKIIDSAYEKIMYLTFEKRS